MIPDFLMRNPKLVLVLKSDRHSKKYQRRPTLQSMANPVVHMSSDMSRHVRHVNIYPKWRRNIALSDMKCRHKILVPTKIVSPTKNALCKILATYIGSAGDICNCPPCCPHPPPSSNQATHDITNRQIL